MNSDKLFFRHVFPYYFDLKKTAAEAHHLLFEVMMKEHVEFGLNASETVILM